MKDKFFSKLDWAAFWTATAITFIVYFLTLGPSVGLEDSGELATAAANLGVPHPPGYPFWTFCSWLFCKAFCWVTYMGYPTPAWCVSLCSAVFGAFAAGCTAMLICRSAHDFISDGDSTSADSQLSTANALLCFGGAVGGALTFALSPVEWSQSTIVEIYSLNALFLMWVFLLSYRWMRKPSDKILWFTAFVFGLGLTNYQVLLFAIVPLALIIALKNIGMFRDVFIYLIPVGLTWQILQIGQLFRADGSMQSDVINKHLPIGVTPEQWGRLRHLADGRSYYERFKPPEAFTDACPHTWMIVLGLVLIVAALVLAAYLLARKRAEAAGKVLLAGGGAGVVVLILSTLITSSATWSSEGDSIAPLMEPVKYLVIAAFIALSVILAAVAATKAEDLRKLGGPAFPFLAGAAGAAIVAIVIATSVPEASSLYYSYKEFPWGKSTGVFISLIAILFALCSLTKRGLAFAIPVAGLHIAAFILLAHGAMNGLTHPCSWWFGWGIAWNFILLALAYLTLPNGRSVAGAAFFAQLGVSFYVYMPIVSDMRNPPMNWGYPRTWEGFKHALMRGQYEAITFQKPTWVGIAGYFKDVLVQFTDVLALLALVPFAGGHWLVKKENRKQFWSWMIPAVVCFLLMSVLLIGLANVKGDLQDGFIQKVKFISSHAMLALWIGYGLVLSIIAASKLSAREAAGRRSFWIRYVQVFGIALIALLVFWAMGALADYLFLKSIREWICNGMTLVSVTGKCLCLIMILILLLTAVASFFRRFRRGEKGFAIVMTILVILVALVLPLVDNYCGDYRLGVNEVAFKLGGSEQNGHTFGWQFGAYQLEGANAIKEQIVADEEPLPDPDYPPPMDKFSIFFGGTDPGRFVPTYMIYSALFRPDVYLITQNALADDTYMSVERDLYGDEIWIPAKEDSEDAFNIYVDEVQSGKRQANGDLQIANGRVQVTGALGVMEINGILTEMMHKHDKYRHSFYVEESYVIPWMYSYLSPHGLIMKLNAEKTPYDAKRAKQDRDFWDWYTRRLLDDPMYGRDFAGQKSFSKLRAAIAGLYQKQGRYQEAAQAYREAVLLYPASPEASFRYAQESLLPFRKYDVALELMDYTDYLDPNNRRTASLRGYVEKIQRLTSELARLEAKRRDPKTPLSAEDMLLLATCYYDIGRIGDAGQMVRGAIDALSSADALLAAAQILDEAKIDGDAERAYVKYLKLRAKDVSVWADLALVQKRMGKKTAAERSFIQAYSLNRQLIYERIQKDKALYDIAAPLFKQR